MTDQITRPVALAGTEPIQLTRKDFVSDQEVRWCPGCGDYSILAQTQKVMPDFGVPKENIVFISGIGCSGRLPYYMNTYGFHTIHGRAPTIATGLKASRPELMVWVITGDGDALSIGGNHLLHSMRRNVDLTMIMHNNRIYGLTKGQTSPTSEFGKRTKSTPMGSVDRPIQPLTIALAAEATFVARTVDTHTEHIQETLEAAGRHRGSSFVEVLQNCNIFNDGAWRDFTDREVREDRMLILEHGKPMIFGKERDKGIRLNGLQPEVVTIGEDGVTEADLLVHDAHAEDPYLALILSRMFWPEFPVPVGVLRDVDRPTHSDLMDAPDRAGDREVGRGRPRQGARSPARPGPSSSGIADALPRLPPRQLRGRGHAAPTAARTSRAADVPQPALEFHDTVLGEPPPRARRRRRRTSVDPTDLAVADAIRRMHEAGTDCLLVCDGDRLVGIFTDRDAVVKVADKRLDAVRRRATS